MQAKSPRPVTWPVFIVLFVSVGLLLLPILPGLVSRGMLAITPQKIGVFATIFLGIFIEAGPFLLLGTLASGLVDEFVDRSIFQKYLPQNRFLNILAGACMGLLFPVCECGVVPLVRKLLRKGAPVATGIAFLLSAPVINPIVIFSTATAFGIGKVLLIRVAATFLIAVIVALIFSQAESPWEILRPTAWSSDGSDGNDHDHDEDACDCHVCRTEVHTVHSQVLWERFYRVFLTTRAEFFEMGKYLVIGASIAAGMQTFIPQSNLLGLASGNILSVLVLMLVAVLLSICSTVDSFVALGFVNTFPLGAIVGFLVFGPMVDIKSTLMYCASSEPKRSYT